MAVIYTDEIGGDFISLTGDRGLGQLMVTVRSIESSDGVLVCRSNWDTTSPSWSSPTTIQSICYAVPPEIGGPLAQGRVIVWFVNTSGNLEMKYSDDAGDTWNG